MKILVPILLSKLNLVILHSRYIDLFRNLSIFLDTQYSGECNAIESVRYELEKGCEILFLITPNVSFVENNLKENLSLFLSN
jgi:hypothetical protein